MLPYVLPIAEQLQFMYRKLQLVIWHPCNWKMDTKDQIYQPLKIASKTASADWEQNICSKGST